MYFLSLSSVVCGLVVWRLGISFDSFIFLPPSAPLSYAYLDFNNTISLQTQEPEIKTSNGQWESVGHFLFKSKLQYLIRITYIVSLIIGVFLKNHNNIIHIYIYSFSVAANIKGTFWNPFLRRDYWPRRGKAVHPFSKWAPLPPICPSLTILLSRREGVLI